MTKNKRKSTNRTNMKRTRNDQNTACFVSSHILLEMAKDEYTKERERTNALDSKASFFITVIIAIATILIPIIPFGKMIGVMVNGQCWQKCLMSVLICGIILSLIMLIIAFTKLYDAYRLMGYKRPSLEAITDVQFHEVREDIAYKGLCDHYKDIVDYNVAVNQKKCDSITNGIKHCGIGILLLTITTICLQIVIGG